MFNRVLDAVQEGDRSVIRLRLIPRSEWDRLRLFHGSAPTRAVDCRRGTDTDGVSIIDCAVAESGTQTNTFAYLYRSRRTSSGWRVGHVYLDVG